MSMGSSWGRPASVMVVLFGMTVALSLPTPADADTSGEETVSVGSGSQYAKWSLANNRVKLSVITGGMSSARCQDSMLDWHTDNGHHYDNRVIRDCKPGSDNFSYGWEGDKADSYGDLRLGDQYWDEPSPDFDHSDNMQRGAGYVIDDDYHDNTFELYAAQNYSQTMGVSMSNWWNHIARTCTDKFARVMTHYQDGHYTGCKNLPANSYD